MTFNKNCTACSIKIGEDKYKNGELFVTTVIILRKENSLLKNNHPETMKKTFE